ncbi:MAG: hypothetical protein IJY39_05660 [Clostridia bacterium]|nr:hypothetical protein [Clostridia bacterium]
MDIKKAFKNFIFFGSVYYTVITAVILIIASAMAEEDAIKLIEIDRFLKVLLFSFIMSLGSTLIRIEEVGHVAAVCLHAACYIVGWLIFIILCGGSFAISAISTAVFAVVYVLVSVTIRLITGKKGKKAAVAPSKKQASKPVKEKRGGYSSQFH